MKQFESSCFSVLWLVLSDHVDKVDLVFHAWFFIAPFLQLPGLSIARLINDGVSGSKDVWVLNNATFWSLEIRENVSIESSAQASDFITIFITSLQHNPLSIVGDCQAVIREDELCSSSWQLIHLDNQLSLGVVFRSFVW